MPTAYHSDCCKPVVVKRSIVHLPRRAKSFHSKSAPNSPLPSRETSRPVKEPRYTKAVHLLFEAKRLAKELEEKKRNGELIKYRPRGRSLKSREADQWESTIRECESCSASLKSGMYSIHQDLAFCNVPCYSMLFSSLSSKNILPTSDGKMSDHDLLPEEEAKRNFLIPKLRTYNTYYSEKPCQISCIETGRELILEGQLKVYWGLKSPLTLAERDVSYWRNFKPELSKSWNYNFVESVDENGNKKQSTSRSIRRAKSNYARQHDKVLTLVQPDSGGRVKRSQSTALKRNGRHLDSVQFTPPHGSSTILRISDKVKVPEVVSMLLKKFQICNRPEEFTLYTVYESGSIKKLNIEDSPLAVRLRLGPCEDVAKVFIMEKEGQSEVSDEVAQYAQFSMPVLEKFVEKFQEEEEREINRIKAKYESFKAMLKLQLEEIHNNVKETDV